MKGKIKFCDSLESALMEASSGEGKPIDLETAKAMAKELQENEEFWKAMEPYRIAGPSPLEEKWDS